MRTKTCLLKQKAHTLPNLGHVAIPLQRTDYMHYRRHLTVLKNEAYLEADLIEELNPPRERSHALLERLVGAVDLALAVVVEVGVHVPAVRSQRLATRLELGLHPSPHLRCILLSLIHISEPTRPY